MSSEQTFVGIDIGTTQVRCVIGMRSEEQEVPTVIGAGSSRTTACVVALWLMLKKWQPLIVRAVEEAERISGQRIDRSLVSVNGTHILALNSKGVVAISGVR